MGLKDFRKTTTDEKQPHICESQEIEGDMVDIVIKANGDVFIDYACESRAAHMQAKWKWCPYCGATLG